MKLKLYLLVSTLLVLSAVGHLLRAQQSDKKSCPMQSGGVVTGITGNWKEILGEHETCELHFLLGVTKDFCAEGTDGVLVVVFDNDPYSYACDRPSDRPADDKCEKNREPPDKDGFKCLRHISPVKAGFVQRAGQSLSAAVIPLFQESPARYIRPVSRGLEAEVADSVVPLQGDRLDLAPVFQEMDPGTYRLRLESLPGSARATAPLQLQWSGSGPAAVSAPGIQPGLYRLVRLAPNGEPAGSDAWVLVTSPDHFAQDSASFQSAVEATKKWPDDVDARAPRAVLRAYLDSLSRRAQTEQ